MIWEPRSFASFLNRPAKAMSHRAAVLRRSALVSELDRIRQVTDDMVMRAQQAYQAATGRDLEAQLARAILQAVLTPPGAISTSEPV